MARFIISYLEKLPKYFLLFFFLFCLVNSQTMNSACAGINEWTPIGPEGGPVSLLAIDSVAPDTLYAGSFGGGVFKSTNGGANWTAINTGMTNTEVTALAIDPLNHNTLYAGTGGGVFKSTNGGANWTAVNTGLANLDVHALAIDPLSPDTLYAGTSQQLWVSGVFKSTNSGANWSAINTGMTNTNVTALAIDPLTPTILYAGTWGGGIYKSTNGGANWSAINTGLSNTYVHTLAIDPITPSTFYAGTLGGVFKSTDGGANWSAMNTGFTTTYINTLGIDPVNPDTIYAATDGGGVFKYESTTVVVPPGYAIIVAGKGGWREKWGIDHSANNAYRVLRNLGLHDEDIIYLNPNSPQDIDGDGNDEVDGPASFTNFKNAINETKNKIQDKPIPLILYLTGHGEQNLFVFDPDDLSPEGEISASNLREMLNGFSSNTAMLIVIGSCSSGSFITSDQSISGSNRIIITAAHDETDFWSTRVYLGWVRSADRFLGNLNKGLNVKEAFVQKSLPGDWLYLWLDDNGDMIGHSPYNLEDDGVLAAATKIGIPGTEQLELTPWFYIGMESPAELRVFDSENRVTGLVNGETKEEIPNSIYDDRLVAIFSPSDVYRFEAVGTSEGTYGLDIAFIKEGEATTFTANSIPIGSGALHQYNIDWAALSQGQEGTTVEIDSNGDGVFEQTIKVYNQLTQIRISGGAYFYPETPTYRASFSMDVTGPLSPSGWLKHYYTRTRMNFVSTGITSVSASGNVATISGTGMVNGVGGYRFTATVTNGSPDTFAIVVKKPDGTTYYSAGPKNISGGDLVIQ